MSRFRSAARGYVRPMRWWWAKKPFFVLYMIREGSAVFLSLYALVLLAGLGCLAWGPGAYAVWLAWLQTPAAIAFHAVAFAVVLYHSVTWFQVMPKTAPKLPIDPRLIVRGGLAASAGLSLSILIALLWVTR
jgi:fumarate reductase subunit C